MRRPFIAMIAAAAVGCGSSVFAQGGDLRGVTMRVLDDLRDVDAVVIELGPSNVADEEAGKRDRTHTESAEREGADAAAQQGVRFDEPKELHDPDDDERAEGKLEDRDVEQPAAPAVP